MKAVDRIRTANRGYSIPYHLEDSLYDHSSLILRRQKRDVETKRPMRQPHLLNSRVQF